MKKVFGVRFKTSEENIYYENGKEEVLISDFVVCKTKNGTELGKVRFVGEFDENQFERFKVFAKEEFLRKATSEDLNKNEENKKFAEEAFVIGQDLVKKQNLKMDIVLVVSNLDRTKFIFFFTSEERVDFRNLVRKLAFSIHSRVELKQIGTRDEAKIICGIGSCGRPFCCSSFLKDFKHVSIKMAKEQNLSLNPKKISGCCGKLMCCLRYEQSSYSFLNKICPKLGSIVMSPDGEGVVVNGNPLTGKYQVKLVSQSGEEIERIFNKDSLKLIRESKLKKKHSKNGKKAKKTE